MSRHAFLTMFVCAIMALSGLAVSSPAQAGGRDYPPLCHSQSVLNRIVGRFGWAERRTWHRGFQIEEIVSPQLRYQVLNGPTAIKHDHCSARAIMTNGTSRRIYYSIERGQGFASIGNNVRFCIVGLDPWRIYGAACSTVR
ncbi:MAG TPA: hypothetical protein VKN63_06915 [Afifellaceae bacterium]|nr:hypothetical protein [Afifellaceae bacterium]